MSWCCITTTMILIQLYTYTCGSKINNNDERTHFLRKIYLSHFLRNGYESVAKGLCVRGELETEQTATYWPSPSSFVFCSTSFSFCWAARSGSWGLLGAGSLDSFLSPTNSNCLSHRVISLFDIHLLPVSVAFTPNSTRPRSRLYLDIFDRMQLFLDWRLSGRSICYTGKKVWIYFNLHFVWMNVSSDDEQSWWIISTELNMIRKPQQIPQIIRFNIYLYIYLS